MGQWQGSKVRLNILHLTAHSPCHCSADASVEKRFAGRTQPFKVGARCCQAGFGYVVVPEENKLSVRRFSGDKNAR